MSSLFDVASIGGKDGQLDGTSFQWSRRVRRSPFMSGREESKSPSYCWPRRCELFFPTTSSPFAPLKSLITWFSLQKNRTLGYKNTSYSLQISWFRSSAQSITANLTTGFHPLISWANSFQIGANLDEGKERMRRIERLKYDWQEDPFRWEENKSNFQTTYFIV